ncbi:MAG TPA: DUF4349 domain-containing protein [Thermoanaerobaculia bacterium]|jgi:hypothetical protein|nr:DUF4349 domain-containing protein [Thermoanaerobaculia bacterium]
MKRIAVLLLLLAAVACKKEEVVKNDPAAAPQLPVGFQVRSPAPPPADASTVMSDESASSPGVVGGAAPPVPTAAAVPPTPQLPRMMIRTATISMVVGDTGAVIDRITSAVEANGGYINDSKIWRDGEQLRATLSLRVPAARLTPTLAAIRHLAVRVQSENVSSTEVTQEYVDLSSRLRNLEATETELRELLTSVREKTKRASDVLEVYQQLVEIRNQIETTKGRMQYLGQLSAFSTINLELVPDAIAKPVVEPGWQPVVVMKDAGRSLVNALKFLATALIWLVIYVVPVVGIFLLLAYAGWKMVRRRAA